MPTQAAAEQVAVPTSRLAELPEEIPFVTAAALPLAGLAALRLLRVTGPLPSRTVLLTGASGGLGHYFTELAAGQGALVTAITASANRGTQLRELGAVRVLPDVKSAARRSTSGSTPLAAAPPGKRGIACNTRDADLARTGQPHPARPRLLRLGRRAKRHDSQIQLHGQHPHRGGDLATLVRLVGRGGAPRDRLGQRLVWRRDAISALLNARCAATSWSPSAEDDTDIPS